MTVPPEAELTYAEVMRKCKESVCLAEFDIDAFRLRRAVTGGLILEVPRDRAVNKADLVAEEFRRVLAKGYGLVAREARRVARSRIRRIRDP